MMADLAVHDGPIFAFTMVLDPHPRPVIAHDDSHRDKAMATVDMRRSARNIACARMRGADKESLLSEIGTQCHPLPEGSCVTCDSQELLQRWATRDPPLRIR